jgi:hypothetical protein
VRECLVEKVDIYEHIVPHILETHVHITFQMLSCSLFFTYTYTNTSSHRGPISLTHTFSLSHTHTSCQCPILLPPLPLLAHLARFKRTHAVVELRACGVQRCSGESVCVVCAYLCWWVGGWDGLLMKMHLSHTHTHTHTHTHSHNLCTLNEHLSCAWQV